MNNKDCFDGMKLKIITIKSSKKTNNLGVILADEKILTHHVRKIGRTGFYNISNFATTRK